MASWSSSNGPCVDDWTELLPPEIERQQAVGRRVAFQGDAALAKPEVCESSEEHGV